MLTNSFRSGIWGEETVSDPLVISRSTSETQSLLVYDYMITLDMEVSSSHITVTFLKY